MTTNDTTGSAAEPPTEGQTPVEGFWDGFYTEKDQVWSGRPNATLAQVAPGLAPGTALELGAGEGADAIWLAQAGWQVTAVDVSAVALARAAATAREAGVGERITWERHELGRSFPSGRFDLVTIHYLQSPVENPTDDVLRRAGGAVAPGGTILLVAHGPIPPGMQHEHPDVDFPTPEAQLAALGLPADGWTVVRAELAERASHGHGARPHPLPDSIVVARRHPLEPA